MKEQSVIDHEFIREVKALIDARNADELKLTLAEMHPADIAELAEELDSDDAHFLYHLLDNETAADVLIEMDEEERGELLDDLPSETIARKFIDSMDTDDAVEIIRDLDEDKQEEVLSHIEDMEQASDIVDLMQYDENTAGGLMGSLLTFNTQGLDFVMTAMFVVIFLEQWLKDKKHSSALIGLGVSVLSLVIFGKDSFLMPAMIGILLFLALFKKPISRQIEFDEFGDLQNNAENAGQDQNIEKEGSK